MGILANFDFLEAGKFRIWGYGNLGIGENWNMGIWEYGNMGI